MGDFSPSLRQQTGTCFTCFYNLQRIDAEIYSYVHNYTSSLPLPHRLLWQHGLPVSLLYRDVFYKSNFNITQDHIESESLTVPFVNIFSRKLFNPEPERTNGNKWRVSGARKRASERARDWLIDCHLITKDKKDLRQMPSLTVCSG